MKKRMFLALMGTIACTMSACNEGTTPPADEPIDEPQKAELPSEAKAPNFITCYVDPLSFDVHFDVVPMVWGADSETYFENNDWSEMTWRADSIYIVTCADRDSVNSYIRPAYIYPYVASREDEFWAIAKQNSDTSYRNNGWDNGSYTYRATKFINVTCREDYDEQHPKGTLLNDIVEIRYYSAQPFIDGNYQDLRLADVAENRPAELLTLFNTKSINLLRSGLTLRPTKRPAAAGVYVFTITYCDDTEKTLSATTVPINLMAR